MRAKRMHLEVRQSQGFSQICNQEIVRENSDVLSALKRSISKINTPEVNKRGNPYQKGEADTVSKLKGEKKRKLKKAQRKYEIKEGELRRKSIAQSHCSRLDTLQEKIKLQELWRKASYRAFLTGYVVHSLKEINQRVHLFGTSKGFNYKRNNTYIQEKMMKESKMINPEGKFRRGWDMIVGLLLVYTALALPYRVAFQDSTPLGWMIADGLMDCFFVADIVLNFLTGFREEKEGGKIIMNCRRSAIHYVKGWFIIDLFSTLPFQLIELATQSRQSYNKLLRLARLPRLYRLLRIFKCVRLMKRSAFRKCFACLRIKTGVKRILIVTGLALFFAHLVACFWFLFAKINEFGPDTWVAKRGVANRSSSYQYLVAFYWSVQTITTVGFGDVPTASALEMLLSLLWMILGVGFYSFVMGNFSSMIASIDSEKAKLRGRLNALDKFAQSENIPEPLYIRIKLHIEENLRKQDYVVEKKYLLDSLPPTLKMELMNHTHGAIISTLNFFDSKSWNFIWSAVPLLKALNFAMYEIVYREGDISDECYFIMVGKVSFSTLGGVPYRNFMQGMVFGEVSLLRDESRSETAITATKCELLTLSKLDYKKLLSEFPQEARAIRDECDQKHEYLKQARADIEKQQNIQPIFYQLLEARTCWINFGESFGDPKNTSQTRPSLQEAYKMPRQGNSSFHHQSKSLSHIPSPTLNRKFTKEDSGVDAMTDREQNVETDRTDERRSNPGTPRPIHIVSSRNETVLENAMTFQGEEEKPVFYKRQKEEVSSIAWEEIRSNIVGMMKEIKRSSALLSDVLEGVAQSQKAVEDAVKDTNLRILELKAQREERKEEEKKT